MIIHGRWTVLLGGWRQIRKHKHWPMWHIVMTKEFCEEYAGFYEALIPYYMRCTYVDWDSYTVHWHHKWIAPFVKLWWKYKLHRWDFENYLLHKGIIYPIEEGCEWSFNNWKFNWNWRWYDKITWFKP
jgi:hypothetical protein